MLHLIGGGGHASVVADVAWRCDIRPVTLWSDEPPRAERFPPGTVFERLARLGEGLPVLLAIGDLSQRRRLRARFPLRAAALVDPSVIVGFGVALAEGVVVMPACVINANSAIGPDAIINTGTIIEHDCVIGSNAHLSPGVRLAGAAAIGADSHVGTGAVILPGVRVGAGTVVGAGAVVIDDVPDGVTVVGVPARQIAR